MGIAMVGSNLPALVTARIAGRFAFDVIDHIPDVKADEKGTKVITKNEIKGKIEF